MRWLPAVLLAALVAAAGCTGPPATDGQAAPGPSLAQRLAAQVPPIQWSVADQVDWWERIATDYPKHDANLPMNEALREHLVDEMRRLGFQVEVRTYPDAAQGVTMPSKVAGTELYAIVATKPGVTQPDHRIGLVSHYDTQTATVQGAYDDASGVAAEFAICKALAQVPMERTLACIFFDGEERGLAASEAYVQDVVVEGDEGYTYDFVLGYDMTGINWPGHDWKMYVMVGEPHVDPLYPFTQDLMHKALGYPEAGVEVLDVHDRNSDERNFKEAGVPILRFAGGRNAADYDQYHKPLDTVEHVYEVTHGRANFEKGFATVVEASYVAALALDKTGLAQISQG